MEARDRPLDAWERTALRIVRTGHYHAVYTARVRGLLPPEAVRAGLDALPSVHPLAGVHVEHRRGAPWYVREGTCPVPLRVVSGVPPGGVAPGGAGEAWVDEVNRELATGFPAEGPLVRAVLLPGDDASHLILAFDHLLGDGMGGVGMLEAVLRVAEAARRGAPLPGLPRAEAGGSIMDLLPEGPRGPGAAVATVGGMARLAAGGARLAMRPPRPMPRDEDAPPGRRTTQVLHRERGDAEALAEAARREGTTVQGAICAAMMRSVAEAHWPGERVWMRCGSVVNLRPFLAKPVGRVMGVFPRAVHTDHVLDPKAPFWGLARDVRAQLNRLVTPERMAGARRSAERAARIPEARLRKGLARIDRFPQPGTGVTNIGRVEPPEGLEAWNDFNPMVSVVGAGAAIGLASASFRGKLNLNVGYVAPLVTRDRARRVADALMATLDEALDAARVRPAKPARAPEDVAPHAGPPWRRARA